MQEGKLKLVSISLHQFLGFHPHLLTRSDQAHYSPGLTFTTYAGNNPCASLCVLIIEVESFA